MDLGPEDEQDKRCQDIIDRLDWQGQVFRISAISGKGTKQLGQAIMLKLEEIDREEKEAGESGAADDVLDF